MDAKDHGIVLRYGGGPGKCDMLGARDVWVFEDSGTYYMHYDAAGPKGWLCSLAVSKDLRTWLKKGPILDFGKPGEDDSKSASYGLTYHDGGEWHMFYLGTPNVSRPPNRVPSFPYLTMKARSTSPAGPWVKQKNVVPFRTKPGTYYSITASPGQVIKHGREYLQFFSATTRKPGNRCVQRTLGIARTRDLDGPWTVDPKPMVPIEEQIENSTLHYEKSNKTWFLFTNHIGIDRGEYTDAVWVYWSKDLNRWDPKDKAVVLDGRNCTWSKKCIGLPSVVRVGGRLALFYDAPGGDSTSHMKRNIGLAWLDLPLSVPNSDSDPKAAAALKREFAAPPSACRAVPITSGASLRNPNLLTWLADRHAGGAVLDVSAPKARASRPEPWTDPTYLNDPVAFKQMRDVMTRLKADDRKVWIYDELGYPSGNAGGRVLAGHPEYAAQAVRCRSLRTSGQPLAVATQGQELISCRALPHRGGVLGLAAAVDLTAKARTGAFTWKPPPGSWTVCLFERFVPDTWKRHNIARRNVNIMDRKAIARFIKLTHDRYARELGPQLDDVVLFFTDEPQLGAVEPWMHMARKDAPPAVQWCDELPVAFKKKYGYPITDALAALFHNVGPSTARYRHDFYDVCGDLIAENYFGQIQDWCHKHRVCSSGHMLLEESLLFHPMFSGSMTKNWSRQDLPGVDQLVLPRYRTMAGWNGGSGVQVKEDFSVKLAASICALTGKRGVFSESYALCDRANVANLARGAKGMAAWQFACGVTHMSTYTLQQKISAREYAGFSDFVGRLALLCRRGQPVSDVAVLVPEASVWAFYNPPRGGTFRRYIECNPEVMRIDDAFRETCHQLLANQRDFEVLTEQLLAKTAVSNGRLELAGQRFAFLVLPEARMLSEGAMRKIEAFAKSGGRVVFTGSLPHMSPAKGEDAAMRKRAEVLIASHADRTRFVKEETRFGQTVRWMAEQVPPRIRWNGPRSIRLAHQREPRRDIILVANPSAAAAQGELACTFGGSVSVWDPETGKIRAVGRREPGQAVAVAVPADSARFVLFGPDDQG